MDTPEQPQLYLITPPELELSSFPDQLARVLDAHDVACVRLALSTRDEDRVMRAADALRGVTDARDIALVIADHTLLAERSGLMACICRMRRAPCVMRARPWAMTPLSAAFATARVTTAWPQAKRVRITSALVR